MNRVALALIGLVVLGSISGCAILGGKTDESGEVEGLSALGAFAVEDLKWALADAQAHQDQAAVSCYTTLLDVVQSGALHVTRPKGAISAFQAGRDILGRGGSGGVSALLQRINLGCAALFVDSKLVLLKLGLLAKP